MIGQTAANFKPYNETESPHSSGSITGDHNFHLKLCKANAEAHSDDTAYAKSIIPEITPEHSDDTTYSKSSITELTPAHSGDTTYAKSKIADITPVHLPTAQKIRYSFSVLQEWEGYVVSISDESFTARLTDLTRNSTIADEEADFPLDDLDDADRLRISPGAIFRWVIGYRRSVGGTKDRSSRIVFRRLPTWTAKEIEKNRLKAAEWASQLKVE